jgi:DNA polymerase III subunit alpha
MSTPQFVHLHVHTEYSIVDGLVRVKPLISTVADMGMPAVAVTDQTNLFAMIKFYSGAIAAGIKPVCGCDVMLHNPENPERPFPMVLLVRDLAGYRNLTRLISRAYTDNQGNVVPVIQKSWLEGMSTGLIALSGGYFGEIGRLLLDGDKQAAIDALQYWMGLFPDSFYLELQRCGRPGEDVYIQAAVELASKYACPLVATNDVRFLKAEDFEAHEVRVCIHERRTLDDPRRSRHFTEQQYLRSAQEMAELFADLPEALQNTVAIARRCNLDIELGKPFLPNYPVPAGMTMDEYFSQLSLEGLEQRMAGDLSSEGMSEQEVLARRKPYLERLEFELNVINQMGFPGYFLIVIRIHSAGPKPTMYRWGQGEARGPALLVAYALGVLRTWTRLEVRPAVRAVSESRPGVHA